VHEPLARAAGDVLEEHKELSRLHDPDVAVATQRQQVAVASHYVVGVRFEGRAQNEVVAGIVMDDANEASSRCDRGRCRDQLHKPGYLIRRQLLVLADLGTL